MCRKMWYSSRSNITKCPYIRHKVQPTEEMKLGQLRKFEWQLHVAPRDFFSKFSEFSTLVSNLLCTFVGKIEKKTISRKT